MPRSTTDRVIGVLRLQDGVAVISVWSLAGFGGLAHYWLKTAPSWIDLGVEAAVSSAAVARAPTRGQLRRDFSLFLACSPPS